MCRVNALLAVWSGEVLSVNCTVKEEVPVALGVPEIVPPELRERPAGSAPEMTDHE
jgi:hypothetical protein